MPRGIHKLGETYFRIGDKMVHVRGTSKQNMPISVAGIKVGARGKRLHILHGNQQQTDAGTELGNYVIHYADGSQEKIPIVYGKNLVDWWHFPTQKNDPSEAKIGWKGSNDLVDRNNEGAEIRLYRLHLDQPAPGQGDRHDRCRVVRVGVRPVLDRRDGGTGEVIQFILISINEILIGLAQRFDQVFQVLAGEGVSHDGRLTGSYDEEAAILVFVIPDERDRNPLTLAHAQPTMTSLGGDGIPLREESNSLSNDVRRRDLEGDINRWSLDLREPSLVPRNRLVHRDFPRTGGAVRQESDVLVMGLGTRLGLSRDLP